MRIISRRILREFWEKHPDASVFYKPGFQVLRTPSPAPLLQTLDNYPNFPRVDRLRISLGD
ncbi:MAG: hypothetical protein BGO78_14110 [Chloroflexi bacterium 44-23]|nr:MAG: hypothetical protein BGO78_14110 [Chloroflexi bacterium 44-23]